MLIVSDGCLLRPSICTNARLIQALEPECMEKSRQLLEKYDGFRDDYNLLREVFINNINIKKALDDILDEVEESRDISLNFAQILDSRIDSSVLISSGMSSAEIVDVLVKPLGFSAAQIQNEIDLQRSTYRNKLAMGLGFKLGMMFIKAGLGDAWTNFESTAATLGDQTLGQYQHRAKVALKATYANTKSFFAPRKVVGNFKNLMASKWNAFKASLANPRGTLKTYIKGISTGATVFNSISIAASSYKLYSENQAYDRMEQVLI